PPAAKDVENERRVGRGDEDEDRRVVRATQPILDAWRPVEDVIRGAHCEEQDQACSIDRHRGQFRGIVAGDDDQCHESRNRNQGRDAVRPTPEQRFRQGDRRKVHDTLHHKSREASNPAARATTPHENARSAFSSGPSKAASLSATSEPSVMVTIPETERVRLRSERAGVLNARWPYDSANALAAAAGAPSETLPAWAK